jgi:hypothetical protein
VVEIVQLTLMVTEYVMMLRFSDVWTLSLVTTTPELLKTMALVITVLVYVKLLLTL